MSSRETSYTSDHEPPVSSHARASVTITDSSDTLVETVTIPSFTAEMCSTNHLVSVAQRPSPLLQTLLELGQLPTYKNQTETMILPNHDTSSSIPIVIATNVLNDQIDETDIQDVNFVLRSHDSNGAGPNCGNGHVPTRNTTNEIVTIALESFASSSMNRRLDEQYRRQVVASYEGHVISMTGEERYGPDVTVAAATILDDHSNYNNNGLRDSGHTSGMDREYSWFHSRRRRFAYMIIFAIVVIAMAVTSSHRVNRSATAPPMQHHPDDEEQSMMKMPNDNDTNISLIGTSAPLPLCSTEELYEAVDEYIKLQMDYTMSGMNPSVTSEELLTYRYGYPMNHWDVSRITNFSSLFDGQRNIQLQYYFNENLSSWNVTNATNMFRMFAKLNNFIGYGLEKWDVGNVINMRSMFHDAYDFHANISSWDVSKVQRFDRMFTDAHSFNSNISLWDTSSAVSMSSMFQMAQSFDQNLSQWNVHRVQDFSKMFAKARNFNGDISGWNTSSGTDMDEMFANAYMFNQDVSDWNVQNVVRFSQMFAGATHFNHSLCSWGEQMLQQHEEQKAIDLNVSGMFSVTSCSNTSDPIFRMTTTSDIDIGPFCHSCI